MQFIFFIRHIMHNCSFIFVYLSCVFMFIFVFQYHIQTRPRHRSFENNFSKQESTLNKTHEIEHYCILQLHDLSTYLHLHILHLNYTFINFISSNSLICPFQEFVRDSTQTRFEYERKRGRGRRGR